MLTKFILTLEIEHISFLKYYNGLNETGSKIEDSVVKGAFGKTSPSQARQLISYSIVPHSTVTEPGVSIIYQKN